MLRSGLGHGVLEALLRTHLRGGRRLRGGTRSQQAVVRVRVWAWSSVANLGGDFWRWLLTKSVGCSLQTFRVKCRRSLQGPSCYNKKHRRGCSTARRLNAAPETPPLQHPCPDSGQNRNEASLVIRHACLYCTCAKVPTYAQHKWPWKAPGGSQEDPLGPLVFFHLIFCYIRM